MLGLVRTLGRVRVSVPLVKGDVGVTLGLVYNTTPPVLDVTKRLYMVRVRVRFRVRVMH